MPSVGGIEREYSELGECAAQVLNYLGAVFKDFYLHENAEKYLRGEPVV